MRELTEWTAEVKRSQSRSSEPKRSQIHRRPAPEAEQTQAPSTKLNGSSEKVLLQRELEALETKVAQKRAHCADMILIEGGEYKGVTYKKAEDYGYVSTVRKEGDEAYDRPAIEELIRWRLWDRTGGGLMAELGSHQLDAANIFIAAMHGGVKQHPLSVSASGARSLFSALDRDVDDHVAALYEYPAADYDPNDELGKQRKITVAYATINGNGFGGYGETVFGTKGTLQIDRENEAPLIAPPPSTTRSASQGPGATLDA